MTNPISNDKLSSNHTIQGGASSKGSPGAEAIAPAPSAQPPESPAPNDDMAVLSPAAQRLASASGPDRTTEIESPEQANSLVERLRNRFRDSGGAALAAQGGLNAQQLRAILEAAPA